MSDADGPDSGEVDSEAVRVHAEKLAQFSGEVELVDEAFIVLSQAYCHLGHPLIAEGNPTFQGYPGVKLRVRAGDLAEEVVLSPVHGHHDRVGGDAFGRGVKCSVRCPQCNQELMAYAPCPCGKGTLRAIFLTADPGKAHVAAVCDVWGCQRSRVVDEWEILSVFVYSETEGEGEGE
jgi:hypothetical protein